MPEFLGNRRNWLIGDRKQTHPTADRQTDRQTMILICVLDKWRNSRGGAYVLTNAVFKDITVKITTNKQTKIHLWWYSEFQMFCGCAQSLDGTTIINHLIFSHSNYVTCRTLVYLIARSLFHLLYCFVERDHYPQW